MASDKIKAAFIAAGFSVADPSVNWTATVVVEADRTTGGFNAEAQSTRAIALHWTAVPDLANYMVFRSTRAAIPFLMETLRTMDTNMDPHAAASATQPQWTDNEVEANTRYYYAVVAVLKNGQSSVVATGTGDTPPTDEPLQGKRGGN